MPPPRLKIEALGRGHWAIMLEGMDNPIAKFHTELQAHRALRTLTKLLGTAYQAGVRDEAQRVREYLSLPFRLPDLDQSRS